MKIFLQNPLLRLQKHVKIVKSRQTLDLTLQYGLLRDIFSRICPVHASTDSSPQPPAPIPTQSHGEQESLGMVGLIDGTGYV